MDLFCIFLAHQQSTELFSSPLSGFEDGDGGGVLGGVAEAEVEAGGVALQIGQYLGVFTRLYHVAVWCAQFSADQAGTIPNLWLYGGLTVISGLYAAFFGLSAAAYRLLYHNQ